MSAVCSWICFSLRRSGVLSGLELLLEWLCSRRILEGLLSLFLLGNLLQREMRRSAGKRSLVVLPRAQAENSL